MMKALLEICAGDIESVQAAAAGGANRIELCSALSEGGVTPSQGLMAIAREVPGLKMNVLIRPRGGDFVYSRKETDCMIRDIECARQCGADGVVIGALLPDGTIDIATCSKLLKAASGMSATFHRAFDVCRDPINSLEQIIDLGFDRILTSGCAPTALEGIGTIAEIARRADGRIIIMPGNGVTPDNAASILEKTGCREIHASARTAVNSAMKYRNKAVSMGATGIDEYTRFVTSPVIVASIVKEINKIRTII